jgi:DNA-binding NtrC family response regulator
MSKLEELGISPEVIKKVAAKVKEIIASKQFGESDVVQAIVAEVKKYIKNPPDTEELAKIIASYVQKVKSGEIDVEKYKGYAS